MFVPEATAETAASPAGISATRDARRRAVLQETISDLLQVSHRMARLAAHVSGNTESPAAWRTLSVLLAFGPMRLGELAERSRVTQPTMTKLVHNLVERGQARRLADADDARAWQIAVTPDGEAALLAWRRTIGAALAPLFAQITDDELRILQESVRIVSAGERRADGIALRAPASTGRGGAGTPGTDSGAGSGSTDRPGAAR